MGQDLRSVKAELKFIIDRMDEWLVCHAREGMPLEAVATMLVAYVKLFCPRLAARMPAFKGPVTVGDVNAELDRIASGKRRRRGKAAKVEASINESAAQLIKILSKERRP